jgi:glycosyltransferase 2 family protein
MPLCPQRIDSRLPRVPKMMSSHTTGNFDEGRFSTRSSQAGGWVPLVAAGLIALAAFLLYRALSRYSFDQVVASVMAIPAWRLASAGAFAAASYLCLTGFDWLALRYVRRPLPWRQAALASFISLSLGHNIGFAGLSSGAIRYRFYSRWGLSAGEVAKMVLFSGATVGLGLLILGGIALLARGDLAEEITGLSRTVIASLGFLCLVLAGCYPAAAWGKHVIRVRGVEMEMPPMRLVMAQLVVGPLNFACVAGCLYEALAAVVSTPYLGVASVYVIATLTSLISHIPGGLGVIESVVMFLLPAANVIGAVLVFRFLYFLVPLAFGGVLFAIVEIVFRWRGAQKQA